MESMGHHSSLKRHILFARQTVPMKASKKTAETDLKDQCSDVIRYCFQNLSVDPVPCTINYNLVICFSIVTILFKTQATA